MFGPAIRLNWPDGKTERVRLIPTGKSGGAGEIFEIEHHPGLVAKLYHEATRDTQLAHYAHKIDWMIRNPPALPEVPADYQGIVQLAWPLATVTKQSRFAGFVMERIDFDRTLELDYLLTRRQAAEEGFEVDFGKLVTVCHNLASLLHCLHSKKIAVVDLKPINVKVYKSELYVSILDCDGFHIFADDFRSDAPQVTPEYLAPEFHEKAVTHPEAQDGFALSTIIFRLLNYGIHPYVGVSHGHHGHPAELSGRIRQGLYAYGRVAHHQVRGVPASVHEAFPEPLRDLFDRAFASPGRGRPRAHEWARVLGAYAHRQGGQMAPCEKGHLQFSGTPCPSCLRDAILHGHRVRHNSLVARLQRSPARTLKYVKKTLKRTHTSPFQASLAQASFGVAQLANPAAFSTRQAISLEILWVTGLFITLWWVK